MRKTRGVLSGLLVALGILEGTSALETQSSYRNVVRPALPPSTVIASSSTKAKSSHPSPVEIQTELAWLTDPITFPYDLQARIKDGQLHVLGSVASQAIRERALLLAGQYSAIPVLDKMHVQPDLAKKADTVTAAELQQGVMQALANEIGEMAKQFEVKAHSSGQVSIAGSVPNLEIKLTVSQSLRGVQGCVCVVNLLAVAEAPVQPSVIASTERGKPIQASIKALFTSESGKKATVAQEKTTSVWKDAQSVKQSGSKAAPVIDSAASVAPPFTSMAQQTQIAGSSVRTVSMDEKPAKPPQKQSKPPKSVAKDQKGLNEPPGSLPDELAAKPLEGSNSVLTKNKSGVSVDRFQQEITRICGARASNIQVHINPDNSVAIAMECKNKTDAERLSQQILHMPSLARFEVSLDVHYEP
ncbi:MAG: BON domain-containing protein [Gemmataceae bacterium]